MREELKNFDWFVYGLTEHDFDYTINLLKRVEKSIWFDIDHQSNEAKSKHPPDISGEIISDIRHYAWVDIQYLRHFCLWRLQAIFEGLITETYLPKVGVEKEKIKDLHGLGAKLKAMGKNGYKTKQEHKKELFKWADFRNALSHAPPERWRPSSVKASITEEDLNEYMELLKCVMNGWSNGS